MQKIVRVEQVIEVTVDESKFTDAFMAEFRASLYPFQNINDHVGHLGQLHARGLADNHSFIEGYGPADEMGIKFEVCDQEHTVA